MVYLIIKRVLNQQNILQTFQNRNSCVIYKVSEKERTFNVFAKLLLLFFQVFVKYKVK